MTARRPLHELPDEDLVELCRTGVPGYDPWRDAGDEFVFDVDRARRAIRFFFVVLVFVEGERAGQPFALERWQAAIVGNLFGWVSRGPAVEPPAAPPGSAAESRPPPPPGMRRYREVFVFIPRKNGKTSLAAGLVLYLLVCDGEMGAQVYSAAADKDQAALIFRHAMLMVQLQPQLAARCTPFRAFKSIEVPESGSIYRALSSDAGTKHGLNTHAVVVDELHAHPKRDLVDVLQTSVGARRQSVILHITTSDYERESICNEKYAYARSVRDGTLRAARFLPVIYEASRTDDWRSPATWRKANPNLGVSIFEDALALECEKAVASPAYLNTFLRMHLNVRTTSNVALLDPARWAECTGPLDFKALRASLRGKRCFGGLDLASTRDLTAFALWFPEQRALLVWCWAPRDSALRREQHDRVPYTKWAREGALLLTGDGPREESVSYATIRRDIAALAAEFDVQEIAFDRYGANETVTALRDEHGLRVIDFGQGFVSMSAPTKEFERLVRSGELRHGGHPVLTWAVGNLVVVQDDADNWKPSKRRSTERIDPVVASIMAIGVAQLQLPGHVPWVASVSADAPAAATPAAPPAAAPTPRPVDTDDDPDREPDDEDPDVGVVTRPPEPDVAPSGGEPDDDEGDALRAWLFDDE